MEQESVCISTASYDRESGLELYRLRGRVPAFPPHFHQAYLLGVVSGGCRTLSMRGNTARLGVGCVVLLSPGELHSCGAPAHDTACESSTCDASERAASTDTSLDFRGFYVTDCTMRRWLESAGLPAGGALCFSQAVVRDAALYRALLHLHCFLMGEEPRRLRSFLFAWAARQLFRYLRAEASESDASSRMQRSSEGACAYMRNHLTESLSLSQLARSAGMSKPTLHRRFAEERGMSPRRYWESLRVEQARRCLRGGMTPVEAALLFGYVDQSHFSRRFRKLTGFTPGHYRGLYEGEGRRHAL